MTVYRFAYDLYLPTTWAYCDDAEPVDGAQVWNRPRDVAFAAVGGNCDGRYDDQPHVLLLDVSDCSGDRAGCDWPVILPSDLQGARRVATTALAAWAREQTAAWIDDDQPTPRDVELWAEEHEEAVAAWLDAHAEPCSLTWKETL